MTGKRTTRQCIICGKTNEPLKLIQITRLRLKVYVHITCLEALRDETRREGRNGDEPDWK